LLLEPLRLVSDCLADERRERYLADVVGKGSFDEQRDRLAAAMTAAQEWLAAAPRDGEGAA
jgi:hypothetical protein